MTDEFGIAGKTLLVTGSGRNIGKAIVLEFAARGANVVINTRSNAAEAQQVAAEAEALGAKAIVVLGDAAEKATVLELRARAEEAQLRHLGWLTELTGTRIGRWPSPVRMSRTPPYLGGHPNRAAPLYGEDNAAILTGRLGMSDEEVAELTEQGVL